MFNRQLMAGVHHKARAAAVVDPARAGGTWHPPAALPSGASVSTSFSHGTPALAACCRRRPGAPAASSLASGTTARLHLAPAAHSSRAKAARRRMGPAALVQTAARAAQRAGGLLWGALQTRSRGFLCVPDDFITDIEGGIRLHA